MAKNKNAKKLKKKKNEIAKKLKKSKNQNPTIKKQK